MKHPIAAAVAVLLILAPRASADTLFPKDFPIHIVANSTLRRDSAPEVEVRLPPGYFFDEPTWSKLDDEVRRLQEQEVRLTAENESLRNYSASYFPVWAVVGASLAVGISAGIWIGLKVN